MTEDVKHHNDTQMMREFSKLLFSAADKTFKFVSWGIIITVVQYAYKVTESGPLYWLVAVLLGMYGLALAFTALTLPITDLSTLHIAWPFRVALRILLVVVGYGGMALMLAGGSANIVDRMMDDVSKATHPVPSTADR